YAVRDETLVDVQRLLDHVPERRLMSLPAEGTDGQVRVDPAQRTRVDGAVGSRDDATERDTFGGECLLDPASLRAGLVADGRRLRTELGAHLSGEQLDRPH